MAHISGFARDQLLLLPEAVDDSVEADNSVRFIDVFVDGLDLAAAGFGRVEAKATGRPGYAPGDLLKLYIYGYLNRVRSSRRLERECRCNVEVIWLLGALKPDFKTIADFRRDNRAAFRGVFRQFVLLCRRLDLYGRELLAVDGTRIKAVSTTRTATSPALRCARSSMQPTSGWRTTSSGSTRAMSRTGRQAAGRAPRTWPRRSQRSARNAAATKRCWLSSSEPARTRSR
jgi:transposase